MEKMFKFTFIAERVKKENTNETVVEERLERKITHLITMDDSEMKNQEILMVPQEGGAYVTLLDETDVKFLIGNRMSCNSIKRMEMSK